MLSTPARPSPGFLAPAFSADELGSAASSIAVIEPGGAIVWVNRGWTRFADDNGGGGAVRVASGSYFDAIPPVLRGFYESAFANALVTGDVFQHEYECSSPEVFRLHHLRALPIDGHGLILEHSLAVQHPHEAGADAVAGAYRNEHGLIVQCSNCRRVRRPGTQTWDWVPSLVARMDPRTSHGVCASCVGFYWARERPTR